MELLWRYGSRREMRSPRHEERASSASFRSSERREFCSFRGRSHQAGSAGRSRQHFRIPRGKKIVQKTFGSEPTAKVWMCQCLDASRCMTIRSFPGGEQKCDPRLRLSRKGRNSHIDQTSEREGEVVDLVIFPCEISRFRQWAGVFEERVGGGEWSADTQTLACTKDSRRAPWPGANSFPHFARPA
jgi:hypothetical protein